MKVEIHEKVLKRCFFKDKEGKSGMIIHKSVVLSEGSIIRYDRKNSEWKFMKKVWNSKVSKSLMRGSLSDSIENGREIEIGERFSDFKKFSERMVGILGIEKFFEIVEFLK